jgi:iron-sulfur cluster assembly protein
MDMNLTITRAAARFIRMSLLADGKADSGFRLAVSPGGCSGLSADVGVAATPAGGERAVVIDGLRLFLNAQSRILLDGVTVDFEDTMTTQGLVFHDPRQVACSTAGAA